MPENIMLKVIKRQFESSYQMLLKIVEICPEDVWLKVNGAFPFWQQIYHASYWLDFWLRDAYDGSEFRSMIFDESISFELNREVTNYETHLTKAQLKEYIMKIHVKTERIFEKLNDVLLATPIIKDKHDYTYANVIMGQIRHIMYHVGHCNSILRNGNLPAVEWISHNEKWQ